MPITPNNTTTPKSMTTPKSTTDVDWAPTLLVIDDDPTAHDLTDYYLSTVVAETLHASSGPQGVRLAKEVLPDAILLDIEMPGMDGFQVCRQLKETDSTRDIPILFLTKDKDSFHIAQALDAGGSDYVTKPFVPIELQARVRLAFRVKRANDALKKQALFDPLTNLGNRGVFDHGLRAAVAEYARNAHAFALLILDLDHFKLVNDRYGHGVGDEVLVQVAKVIRRTSRPYDVVARYGGEEFGVILNQTERAEAKAIGLRILEAIRQQTISVGERRFHVTASAGLACTSEWNSKIDAATFFEQADSALYKAKQSGRDCLAENAAGAGPRGQATLPAG